jgi:hypothetical protein
MPNVRLHCPHCAQPVDAFLPVEPMYELPVAALFLGMSVGHLKQWLSRHKEIEPIYRKDAARRLHRLLPASAIRYILEQRTFYRPAKGERVRKLADRDPSTNPPHPNGRPA